MTSVNAKHEALLDELLKDYTSHSLYKKSKSLISRGVCTLGRRYFKPRTFSCYALSHAAPAWQRRGS
jgi:hypothetical protein